MSQCRCRLRQGNATDHAIDFWRIIPLHVSTRAIIVDSPGTCGVARGSTERPGDREAPYYSILSSLKLLLHQFYMIGSFSLWRSCSLLRIVWTSSKWRPAFPPRHEFRLLLCFPITNSVLVGNFLPRSDIMHGACLVAEL